jgi:hypothetical protein
MRERYDDNVCHRNPQLFPIPCTQRISEDDGTSSVSVHGSAGHQGMSRAGWRNGDGCGGMWSVT